MQAGANDRPVLFPTGSDARHTPNKLRVQIQIVQVITPLPSARCDSQAQRPTQPARTSTLKRP